LSKKVQQFKERGSRTLTPILTKFVKRNWKRKDCTLYWARFRKQEAPIKAWEQQTEAEARSTCWRQHDRCEWTGRPTMPARPATNTWFNTPDIQRDRDRSNTA